MSNFGSKFSGSKLSGSKLSGSKLKYRLGAGLLLLGAAWLAQAAITINLNDGTSCTDGTITQALDGSLSVSCSTTTPPPSTFNLTVNKLGNGTGTLTCNTTSCASTYPAGTPVTLVAAATGISTFAGWGDNCSANGSGTTCFLTMDADHRVSATFTAPAGSDPGAGLWINGSNYVHDRGGLSELYVPRCVPNQYSNCRAGGNQSPYDTVVWNQVWAMRIPAAGSGFANQRYPFSIQRSESGETLNGFDFAISTTPGDFNVTAACKATGDASLYVYGVGSFTPSRFYPACPLTPGSRYYLNVRPAAGSAGATQCGTSSPNACRYRIVLPTGFPYAP